MGAASSTEEGASADISYATDIVTVKASQAPPGATESTQSCCPWTCYRSSHIWTAGMTAALQRSLPGSPAKTQQQEQRQPRSSDCSAKASAWPASLFTKAKRQDVAAEQQDQDPYIWHQDDFPKHKPPLVSRAIPEKRYKEMVALMVGKPVDLDLIGDMELERRLREHDFGPQHPLPAGWKKDIAKVFFDNM